jgi:hypothetical protein
MSVHPCLTPNCAACKSAQHEFELLLALTAVNQQRDALLGIVRELNSVMVESFNTLGKQIHTILMGLKPADLGPICQACLEPKAFHTSYPARANYLQCRQENAPFVGSTFEAAS